MRKRSACLFLLTCYNNYGNVIWGYGVFEVSYSVCVKIRFSGHMLGFEYASLRSLISSKKSRLGNLDFFFVYFTAHLFQLELWLV